MSSQIRSHIQKGFLTPASGAQGELFDKKKTEVENQTVLSAVKKCAPHFTPALKG
jgi:hypothetical protein